MSIAEIILLILLLTGGYRGYSKGLIREIVAIVALILGFIAGSVFVEEGKVLIANLFDTYSPALPVFSFLLIFVCVVVVVTLLGRAVKTAIDLTPIGYLDSAGGALLGILKWGFVISLLLWVLYIAEIRVQIVEESQWYGKIKLLAPLVIDKLQVWFPAFKDLIKEIQTYFESLKA